MIISALALQTVPVGHHSQRLCSGWILDFLDSVPVNYSVSLALMHNLGLVLSPKRCVCEVGMCDLIAATHYSVRSLHVVV